MGIKARVVHDVVTENGSVLEDTFDWYAQDADGNLWYLGEDTKEYENGKLKTTEGSWEAGVDGAQPGVILPAHPEPGLAYREEYYKGHAEDGASVLTLDAHVKVPRHYHNLLLTRNYSGIEPDSSKRSSTRRESGPCSRSDLGRRRPGGLVSRVEAVDELLEHVLVPAVHEVCVEPELPRGEPRSLRPES